MTLINKIGVLCAGSVSTVLVSSAISYGVSTETEKISEKAPNNSPGGGVAKGDEEGGDAGWKAQADKKFK